MAFQDEFPNMTNEELIDVLTTSKLDSGASRAAFNEFQRRGSVALIELTTAIKEAAADQKRTSRYLFWSMIAVFVSSGVQLIATFAG